MRQTLIDNYSNPTNTWLELQMNHYKPGHLNNYPQPNPHLITRTKFEMNRHTRELTKSYNNATEYSDIIKNKPLINITTLRETQFLLISS